LLWRARVRGHHDISQLTIELCVSNFDEGDLMERNGKATKEAEWVARLRELTTKTKESIFASGDVLIEMKSDLTKKRFKEPNIDWTCQQSYASRVTEVFTRS
jgi:hypothetical protein